MLCDDGVDQDCNGSDCTCIILFEAEWTPPWRSSASSSSLLFSRDDLVLTSGGDLLDLPVFDRGIARSVATRPILLIAVAGDDAYAEGGGGNTGLTTFEVAAISTAPDATNGSLVSWTVQVEALPAGRATHGLDALVYFDYLFTFPGVSTERRSTGAVTPQVSTAARFPYDEASMTASQVLERFESTSASMTTARSYYSLTRLNGGLFLVGGRSGTGPVARIERTFP